MCVGIPAKVIKIHDGGNMADVEIGEIVREAGIHLLDDIEVGQYVLLHAGFAIQIIDEQVAKETLELLEQINEIH